jgi:hypothetical protein
VTAAGGSDHVRANHPAALPASSKPNPPVAISALVRNLTAATRSSARRSIAAVPAFAIRSVINVMLGGSSAVQGFKNYVAESRHRNTSGMVINEAAERRQISQGQHIGTPIDTIDVWKNVAANLSVQPVKASALDFLKEATQIRRGAVSAHFRGRLPGEQRIMEGHSEGASVRDRIDAAMPEVAAIAAQLRQLTQQAGHIVQHQMHRVADRTRGHRP